MLEPVVWGVGNLIPNFRNPGPYSFSMLLDRRFANRCAQLKIPKSTQSRLNELGSEAIRNILKDKHREPYLFEGDSLLIVQCSLGREGRWLSANRDTLQSNAPLEYHGHNIDTAEQAYALLALASTWSIYADTILIDE